MNTLQAFHFKLLVLVLATGGLTTARALAQATILFANRTTGLDAPFYDADGVTRLAGNGYRAALFVGPPGSPESNLAQLGAAQPFRVGAMAGYWESANLPSLFLPGSTFQAQVRFWETRSNTVVTFEQAVQANVCYGLSSVLTLIVNVFGPTTLAGLRSTGLICPTPALGQGSSFHWDDVMAVPNGPQLAELCQATAGPMRWFNATFSASGEAVLRAHATTFPALVAVYRHCPGQAALCEQVVCGNSAEESLRFVAETNVSYGVAVAGAGGNSGTIHLELSLPIRLGLLPVDEQAVEARWPATVNPFRLETSAPLRPASWRAVPGAPVRSGEFMTLRLLMQEPAAIYRLAASVETNQPPTISELPDQTVSSGTVTGPLSFSVWDAETPPDQLIVTATSSNPALVPITSIVLAGSGTSRTVTVTPVSGAKGAATITVTVSDGALAAHEEFQVIVP